MAFKFKGINIPIVSTWDPKGTRKAQTGLQKFGSFATRAFDGLALAAGAFAVKFGVDAVKAAAEAEKSELRLAKALENTTKATDAQIDATEKYITKVQFATGINDNDLRDSLGNLLVATRDVTKAQKLQALALDISAGTGKDLSTVSAALTKAYNGNFGSITRLGVPLEEAIVKSKDFTEVQKVLTSTFGGQSAAAAETYEGKLKRLNEQFGEMQEEVGFLLLDQLQPLMKWVSSPEGGKVIEDFGKAFATAIKAAADALPGILSALKKIGGVASGLGIDPSTFMNAPMLAAAAAFRLTPGPIQIKALAAIAAYAATDNAISEKFDSEIGDSQAFFDTKIKETGTLYNTGKKYSVGGFTNTGKINMGSRGYSVPGQAPQQVVNINVSGQVMDPEGTARAINKLLAQSKRRAGLY
jgi:hypothetical protein